MNLTTRELALISYGYALRIADEMIEEDPELVPEDLSVKERQIIRENIAGMVIKDSKYLMEDN